MKLVALMMAASIKVSSFQGSGTVHAHSLTWLVVTLNGTKPLLVTSVLVLKMSAVKPIYSVLAALLGCSQALVALS